MRIQVTSRGLSLSDEIRDYAERRLEFALDRFESVVLSADVQLADENGPRGGIDQTCRVILSTDHLKEIVASHTAENQHAAIAGAIEIAARSLAKALDKKQTAPIYQRRRALRNAD